MLAVLQVVGQFWVVGLFGALLWRFALESNRQKRLFGARIMIKSIAVAGGGRGLCLSVSHAEAHHQREHKIRGLFKVFLGFFFLYTR